MCGCGCLRAVGRCAHTPSWPHHRRTQGVPWCRAAAAVCRFLACMGALQATLQCGGVWCVCVSTHGTHGLEPKHANYHAHFSYLNERHVPLHTCVHMWVWVSVCVCRYLHHNRCLRVPMAHTGKCYVLVDCSSHAHPQTLPASAMY